MSWVCSAEQGRLGGGRRMDSKSNQLIGTRHRRICAALAGVLIASWGRPASAQDGEPAPENASEANKPAEPKEEVDPASFIESIVVIGNVRQSLLTATNPFTRISDRVLEYQAPRSVADALINIPSLQIDPSFGSTNNQFRFRGIGAGGTQFLEIEEDGIPIQRDSPDFFYRISNALTEIDVTRGGISPIYRTAAVGAIINFKYNDGSRDQHEADAYFQISDFGQRRAELFLGGPITDDTTFSISGWYSEDDGIRRVDFNANQGYNVRASIKHYFEEESGHFKVSGRVFNESNLAYFVGNPFLGSTSDPRAFPGGPDATGTMLSREILQHQSQSAPGVESFVDNTNGEETDFVYVGGELDKKWDNGLHLIARNRYTRSRGRFAGQFAAGFAAGGADFQTGNQLVGNLLGADFPNAGGVGIYQQALRSGFNPTTYQIVNRSGDVLDSGTLAVVDTNGNGVIDPGEATAESTLGSLANGNGVFTPLATFTQNNPFESFQQDIELSYEFTTPSFLGDEEARHRVAVGYYLSDVNSRQDGIVTIFLTDLQEQARLVDVQLSDGNTTVSLTDDGMLAHNIFPGGFRINDRIDAGYLVYEGDLGNLKLDGGLRIDSFRSEQAFFGNKSVFGTDTDQISVPATGELSPATLAIQRRTGPNSPNANENEVDQTFVTYTFGANYRILRSLGVYGRFTSGGLPFATDVSRVNQIELGGRYRVGPFAVAANFFWVNQESDQLTFSCQDASQNLVNCIAARDNRVLGIELESTLTLFYVLTANVNFTFQNPTLTITDVVFESDRSAAPGAENPFDGNRIPQQPQLLGTFGLTYNFDVFGIEGAINTTARFVGERFVDNENQNALQSYLTLGAGLVMSLPDDGWYARVNVQNLTNETALQDAFGGVGGFGTFTGSPTDGFYGRPLVGRNVIVGLGKKF